MFASDEIQHYAYTLIENILLVVCRGPDAFIALPILDVLLIISRVI